MDLAYLISGLAYLFILPLAWALGRGESPVISWKWLAAFGFFFGVSQWLALFNNPELQWLILPAHLLAASTAAACLAVFGWQGANTLKAPFRGWRIKVFLFLLAAAGFWGGWPVLSEAVLRAMVWPAALMAARCFWLLSAKRKKRQWLMRLAAGGLLAGLFLASGPVHSIANQPLAIEVSRGKAALALIQLWLSVAGSIVVASCLWRYYWHECGWSPASTPVKMQFIRDRLLLTLLMLAGLVGGFGAYWMERSHVILGYENLAQQAVFAASFLDARLAGELADDDTLLAAPGYPVLKQWCQQVRQQTAQAQAVWLTATRDGRSFYLADSALPNSPEYSPPGSIYRPLPVDYRPATTPAPTAVTGPHPQQQVEVVTITVPIALPQNSANEGTQVALHMNILSGSLVRTAVASRLPWLFIIALVSVLITGAFVHLRHTYLNALSQAQELERSRRQELAIARLAASTTVARGDLKAAASEIAKLAADVLRASRSGIWLAGPDDREYVCQALFQASVNDFLEGPSLKIDTFPKYFEALSLGRTVNAPDVSKDPRLEEFQEVYFKPVGVCALLDSPIVVEGKLAGVLCVEQTGEPRKWMEDEARFAGELAEAVTRAMLSSRHREMEEALRESEKQLTEIINFLPDPTFIIDRHRRVVYWNRAMEVITGVLASQMLGKGNYEYSLPFYGHRRPILIDLASLPDEEIERGYLEVKRDGESIYAESFVPCLGANGGILWGVARALKDSEGRFTGAIESVRDVSARRRMEYALRSAHDELEQRVKERTYELAATNARLLAEINDRLEAEQRLRESNRLLEGMLNGIPDIVGFQLPDHTILRYNRAGYQALGLTPEQAIGRKCHDLLNEPDECQGCATSKACATKKPMSVERYVPRLGCYMECRSNPLLDENGRVVVIIEQMRDITERRRNEDALRQAHDELEQRVQERTAELAATNRSLTTLLKQQEVNIELAKQVLALIDAPPPRHTPLPGGLNLFVTTYFFPCHAAGGDHYFIRNLGAEGQRRTVLSLKDQSGHEVGCVLRSIMTDLIHNSLLHNEESAPMEKVLARLNDEICASDLFAEGEFFTSINAEIQHDPLAMRYLSTGHPPCLLIRDTAVTCLPAENEPGTNLPAGMMGNQQLTVGCHPLLAGDKILFFTDGLLESPLDQPRSMLTTAQLREQVAEIVRLAPRAGVAQICRALLQALGHINAGGANPAQKDDIALLGVEIENASDIISETIHPQDSEDLNHHAVRLYKKISHEWRENGVENPEDRLRLILEETLLNAWRHGNKGQPNKGITVRRRYGNDAQLEITDEGEGFNSQVIYDPTSFENLAKPSGRGLFIIRMLADEVVWNPQGNSVTLYFSRHPLPQGSRRANEARKNQLQLWQP